jgi:hypothetical protein
MPSGRRSRKSWRPPKFIPRGWANISICPEHREHLTTAIRFFHGGWGKISAAATAQEAIDLWQPDLLVNLGTCGGFEGRIARGTIILVTRTIVYDILEQMSDPDEAISHYSTELDWTGCPTRCPIRWYAACWFLPTVIS